MESITTPDNAPTPPENSPTALLPLIDKKISRPWKGVVVHHSASPDGAVRDWPGIVKYHMSYRVDFNIVSKEEFDRRLAAKEGHSFQTPWRNVGYHGGIELVEGKPFFLMGRPLSDIGAHAGVKDASNRFNTEYIGLCVVGNYDAIAPPKIVWDFTLAITREFMSEFGIITPHVIGHREVFGLLGVPVQKSCPGRFWNMDSFREELKA